MHHPRRARCIDPQKFTRLRLPKVSEITNCPILSAAPRPIALSNTTSFAFRLQESLVSALHLAVGDATTAQWALSVCV